MITARIRCQADATTVKHLNLLCRAQVEEMQKVNATANPVNNHVKGNQLSTPISKRKKR